VLEILHAAVLMVTRIDRLARSIGDLQDIIRIVRARCALLKATEQPIDAGTGARSLSRPCRSSPARNPIQTGQSTSLLAMPRAGRRT
jgi:hypothetical protein